jgi:hypothetical protein
MGDQGPGLSPPEAQLVEESLALADARLDLIPGFQMMAQEFTIPEGLGIAQKTRLFPEVLAKGLERVPR